MLPLAALVKQNTLIMHGGLFRAPPAKARRTRHCAAQEPAVSTLRLGTLDDLRAASKGGVDPDPDSEFMKHGK